MDATQVTIVGELDDRAEGSPSSLVQRFLGTWWFGGVVAAALVLLASDLGAVTARTFATAGVLAALAALARVVSVTFRFGGAEQDLDIVETVLAVAFLVLPAVGAFVVAVAGIAVGEVALGKQRHKMAFNVATASLSTAAALGVLVLVRGGADPLSVRGLAAVTVALVVYDLVCFFGVSEVIARVERTALGDIVSESGHLVACGVLNVLLGITIVTVWQTRPNVLILVLLLAPVVLTVLVHRRVARQRAPATPAARG